MIIISNSNVVDNLLEMASTVPASFSTKIKSTQSFMQHDQDLEYGRFVAD